MKRKIFQNKIENIENIETDKWLSLDMIRKFVLKDNSLIIPNYYMKFKINKKYKYIDILYGDVKPYGCNLQRPILAYNQASLSFKGIYLNDYCNTFQAPTFGDILRISTDKGILFEIPIKNSIITYNNSVIILTKSIPMFDFTDSKLVYSYHNNITKTYLDIDKNGLYLQFIPNKTKNKKYHKRIFVKDITEIEMR